MRTRHLLLGTISPTMEEVRSDAAVASLGTAYRFLQSRIATPRGPSGP